MEIAKITSIKQLIMMSLLVGFGLVSTPAVLAQSLSNPQGRSYQDYQNHQGHEDRGDHSGHGDHGSH